MTPNLTVDAKRLRARGKAYKEIADILGVPAQEARKLVDTPEAQPEPFALRERAVSPVSGVPESDRYLYRCPISKSPWTKGGGFSDAFRDARQEIKKSPLKWYVYAHYADGEMIYIGKGSGNRLWSIARPISWVMRLRTCAKFRAAVLSWHETEEQAYAAEESAIKRFRPPINTRDTAPKNFRRYTKIAKNAQK
jgi:hypothetical protein